MSSVKNIVVEMLSTFESKSRLSAKQLREQLHQCWPVPNSASYVEQLGKELREEMKQALEVVSICFGNIGVDVLCYPFIVL